MRNNSKNPYATGWNYPNHSENNGEPNGGVEPHALQRRLTERFKRVGSNDMLVFLRRLRILQLKSSLRKTPTSVQP